MIKEVGKGIVIITYDIPAVDQWKSNFKIVYTFPLGSKDLELLMEGDTTDSKFYDHFESDAKYFGRYKKVKGGMKVETKGIEPEKRAIIRDILFMDIGDVDAVQEQIDNETFPFELYVNRERIDDAETLIRYFRYLREGGRINEKPDPLKRRHFWNSLTDSQREHNKLIEQDKKTTIPEFVGMGVLTPDGRVAKLEWTFSEFLFTDDEVIDNPDYLSLLRQGLDPEAMDVPEFIPIARAFQKARATSNARWRGEGFKRVSQSVFTLNSAFAFIPNDYHDTTIYDPVKRKTIKTRVPFYNPDKPKIKFIWNKQTGFEPAKGISKGQIIRYPDDEDACSFEEIFYSEFLPPFTLTREYLVDPTGKVKERYMKAYRNLLGKFFDDWITLFEFKEPSLQDQKQLAFDWATQTYHQNPTLYKDLKEEVKERVEIYIEASDPPAITRHQKNFIEAREQYYIKTTQRSNPLATVKTDLVLDQWVERYNSFVEAYNKKQKSAKNHIPKIETKGKEAQRDSRLICALMLNQRGWYYTIPNNDFFIGDALKPEKKDWSETRKFIELGLWQLRKQYLTDVAEIEYFILPFSELPDRISKQSIRKASLKLMDDDLLVETYKEIIFYGKKRYTNPDKYMTDIEEIVEERNEEHKKKGDPLLSLPSKKEVLSEMEDLLKEDAEIRREEYEELLEKAKKLTPIADIKKHLTEEDVEDL